MRNSITIQDVAKTAGVSITTVSHVINKTRPVSDDLRIRVMKAIEQLGYQPNIVARSLRRQETCSIGLIIPNNANPFYAEVANGVEAMAFEHNYNVFFCNSEKDIEKEIKYTELLVNKRVDGILFVGTWIGGKMEHLRESREMGMPIVVADRYVDDINIDTIVSDNTLGGWIATTHLIGLGHQRIGCIRGIPEFTPNADRVKGYEQALRDAGIVVAEELIVKADFQFEDGYKAAQRLLSKRDRPSAIFACNDLMAIGAIRATLDLGFRVPEDISIIGFDDIQMARYANPPLTTVAQPMYQMGAEAAKMLIDRIREADLLARKIVFEPSLIVRGSTAKFSPK